MNRRNLVVTILLLIAAPWAGADDVEEQIRLGLDSYRQGDYKAAIDDLNFAVAQIREKLNAQQATLLPEPLEGWTASETEHNTAAMSMLGGGAHLTRTYRRGDESVEITIMAGSPMVSSLLAMINNPMMLSGNPNMKPYRFKRIRGVREETRGDIKITLALGGQIMVQLAGRGAGEESLESYLAVLDFEEIKRSLLP